MKRQVHLWTLVVLFHGSTLRAQVFEIMRLPKGSDVTLPSPATTNIPLSVRAKLSSTDSPQTIKLMAVHVRGGRPSPIKVAIFDRNSDRVKYVQVNDKLPVLYKFQGLSSIILVPQLPKGPKTDALVHTRLQVKSDKPLTLAH